MEQNEAEIDEMKFRVVYDGPALDNHEMDVKDLVPALISMSALFEEAGRVIYGDDVKVSVKVKASFRSGSFGIDLTAVTSWLNSAIEFFSGKQGTATANLIAIVGFSTYAGKQSYKGLLQLFKWAKGKPITKIIPLTDGKVKIYVDENEEIFEREVIELYKNISIRKSLNEIITKPLEIEGINNFAVTLDEGNTFTTVNKEESTYFSINSIDEIKLSESESEKILQIINLSFNEANKWRFSDGAHPFFADISDPDFINKMNTRELNFSKGDMLLVNLKTTQILSDSKIKSKHEITKVIKKIDPQEQIKIPLN
ncbi:hypothetical protein [Proteus terrae]|uniref:hypothetical protein n=1 Tax=Proteus terrae TaxID=1574161 RepID=UPI0028891E56|nr:hypothetical protein [Proteus terrae]